MRCAAKLGGCWSGSIRRCSTPSCKAAPTMPDASPASTSATCRTCWKSGRRKADGWPARRDASGRSVAEPVSEHLAVVLTQQRRRAPVVNRRARQSDRVGDQVHLSGQRVGHANARTPRLHLRIGKHLRPVTAYNLKRAMSVLGTKKMMQLMG